MQAVDVVLANNDQVTVRVGDVFLKIDSDHNRSAREVEAMSLAPLPPWPTPYTNAARWESVEGLAAPLAQECDWLVAHEVLPADLVDRNRRRAESVLRQWRPVFIHGDLHVLHVFVEGDSVTGILDWSEAAPGDAAFDLASLTFAHPERLDEVMDGYGDAVDPTLVQAWWSYRCLTAVRWLVENGYGPPEEYPEVAMLRSISR